MAAMVGRADDRIFEKVDRQMRGKSQKGSVGSGHSFTRQVVLKIVSISIVATRE
jgi:hypothetical protein